MRELIVAVALVCGACADADDTVVDVVSPEPEPAQCGWRHPEGCEPCPGNRSYGEGNTCMDVAWQGRSPTDFCLHAYPCDYTRPPPTRIE